MHGIQDLSVIMNNTGMFCVIKGNEINIQISKRADLSEVKNVFFRVIKKLIVTIWKLELFNMESKVLSYQLCHLLSIIHIKPTHQKNQLS